MEPEEQQGEESHVVVDDCYYIAETRRRNIPRYNSEAHEHGVRFDGERIGRLVDQEEDIVNVFHAMFESLIERFVEGFAAQDRVVFEIHAPGLDHPIWIQLMRRDQVSVQRILQAIFRVLQSKTAFVLDGDVEIRVIHIAMPEGSGRSNLKDWTKNKRSIICITNKDRLCLARALVTAKARIKKDTDSTVNWNNIRRGQCEQTRLATELHKRAGVPEGPCGLEEVERFQAVLPYYQVNVVTTNPDDLLLFRGPPREKKLHLFYHDNHFDVLTSLPGFLDTEYFCDICEKGYTNFDHHRCHKICQCCFNAKKEECQLSEWIHCEDCDRSFKNPTCFANHEKVPNRSKVTIKPKTKTNPRTICQRIRRCSMCGTTSRTNTSVERDTVETVRVTNRTPIFVTCKRSKRKKAERKSSTWKTTTRWKKRKIR